MADGYIIEGGGDGLVPNPNTYATFRPIPPIRYGGATYIVCMYDADGVGSDQVAVYKTTDAVNFTAPDSANQPFGSEACAFYPTTGGNLIYLSYIPTGGTQVSIQTFDMDTDTFGAVVYSTGPAPQQGIHLMTHRANGDWVVIYNSFTDGPEVLDVYWTKYNGSWSTPVRVSIVSSGSNDQAEIDGIIIDIATGNVAIMWTQTYFSESYATHHRYLTVLNSADALGTNILWISQTTYDGYGEQGNGLYNPDEDTWVYPFTAADGGTATGLTLGLLEASPSAAPTITGTVQGMDGGNGWFPRVAHDIAASTLYFGWAVDDTSIAPPYKFQYVTRPSSGGSWSATPVDFYDNSIDTLTPTPIGPGSITTVDLTVFSVDGGTVRLYSNPICDFQYYFEAIGSILPEGSDNLGFTDSNEASIIPGPGPNPPPTPGPAPTRCIPSAVFGSGE